MKFTLIFFVIGLSVISCFVIKQEIEIVMPDKDSVEALPEQFIDEAENLEVSDEADQVEAPILYSCNPKECKNTCWSQFKKAGSCYKNVCRCR